MTSTGKITIWSRNYICALLANALLLLSNNAASTLISSYTTYLGAGPRLMGLLTGLFFGVALAMRPVAGPVTTRINKRWLMIIVYAMGIVVNLGYALFHSISGFFLFRLINGVQYAFIGSLGVTIAADSLPPEKMSSGLGIYGAAGAIAQSVAPRIGIWLRGLGISAGNTDLGYTYVFLFSSAIMAIAVIPSAMLRSDHKEAVKAESVGKWYQTIISRHAILPSIIMMLLFMAFSIPSSYMVNFGEEISVADVGVFFTVLALVMLVSRPLFGTVSDRLGVMKVFVPGAAIYAIAFFSIGKANTLTLIVIGAVLSGLGYGAAQPVLQSLVMQIEPKKRRPVASNTMFVGMDLGFFFGSIIGGFIRDAATYRAVMLFGIVPAGLAVVLFLIGWPAASRRMVEVRQMEAEE